MRYQPKHKTEVHQKIVQDAARRLRREGLTGASVATVMRDTGLTHGGFYKHFRSKDELLSESLSEAFRQTADHLARAAERAPRGAAWKAIVRAYLSPGHCDHPELGCPVAALASELGRADQAVMPRVLDALSSYRERMLPFMPGRRAVDRERAFFAIFSTMIGAIALARVLPEPAMRSKVLASARDFLLGSF